jgi:hypothetical protein
VAAAEEQGGRVRWLAAGVAAIFAAQAAAAEDCPVTRGGDGWYGNSFLEAGLYPDGKITFAPGGAGFVDLDGALGIKFAWRRLVPGRLEVGGRRLDGDAPPARAYLVDYGNEGFQPTYLVFPTPGCWEITGGVGDARLTFVVLVEKIGEGPAWRFEGLERGWRVTKAPEISP